MGEMFLLRPRPGLCPECATEHDPEQPHNQTSMYYHTKFQMEHKRAPTWEDAMAHCSDEVKATWARELKAYGIEVNL